MADTTFKAEIELADRKIRIEGPKAFVEQMVAKYATAKELQDEGPMSPPADRADTSSAISERELVATKRPRGHHEMVAVLAFALTQAGKAEFTDEDIRRAYIRAGIRPPKVVAQAIRDAKNHFEYVEPTGTRGVYRLTDHGDSVVRFDLPREGVGT
ncbi:MAG: hypothetical protein WCE23_17665 [Candidatus Binatus sp.]|uniref:hypothetical protein n=1 Tax=Candidatus Binatus sp. TaxID=2811406 RepID=UPI003C7202D7